MEPLEARQLLSINQTFVVDDLDGSGDGQTLAWAVGQVNADSGATAATPDQITFGFASGLHTIPVAGPLTINRPVIIDGYSQSGSLQATSSTAATIDILLDGTGSTGDGLVLGPGSDYSTIDGLAIGKFSSGAGLRIESGNNSIWGDYIGTNAAGTSAKANAQGIVIDGSYLVDGNPAFNDASNNQIGGTDPQDRNVISGNTGNGVTIERPTTSSSSTSSVTVINSVSSVADDGSGNALLTLNSTAVAALQVGTQLLLTGSSGYNSLATITAINAVTNQVDTDVPYTSGISTWYLATRGTVANSVESIADNAGKAQLQLASGVAANLSVGSTLALDLTFANDSKYNGVVTITSIDTTHDQVNTDLSYSQNGVGSWYLGSVSATNNAIVSASNTGDGHVRLQLNDVSGLQVGSTIVLAGNSQYAGTAIVTAINSAAKQVDTTFAYFVNTSGGNWYLGGSPTVPPSDNQILSATNDGTGHVLFTLPPQARETSQNVTQIIVAGNSQYNGLITPGNVTIDSTTHDIEADTDLPYGSSDGSGGNWYLPAQQTAHTDVWTYGPTGYLTRTISDTTLQTDTDTSPAASPNVQQVTSSLVYTIPLDPNANTSNPAGPGQALQVTGNTVIGNYIGVAANGSSALGNGADGVSIQHTGGNTVGGSATADRNMIANNGSSGVEVAGAGADTIAFYSVPFQAASAPFEDSILNDAAGNSIADNLILANTSHGVLISHASNNSIMANVIGTTADGAGLEIDGTGDADISTTFPLGPAASELVVITNDATSNTVTQNFIGIGQTGQYYPNNGAGIFIDGSSYNQIGAAGEGNTIDYNQDNGIDIEGSATDPPGGGSIVPSAMNWVGVLGHEGPATQAISNAISSLLASQGESGTTDPSAPAIPFTIDPNWTGSVPAANSIQGNYVGTDAAGDSGLGNIGDGILLGDAAHSTIIGTDDIAALNAWNQVHPGVLSAYANVIGGNTKNGIEVKGDPLYPTLLAEPTTDSNYYGDHLGTTDTFAVNAGFENNIPTFELIPTIIAGNSIGIYTNPSDPNPSTATHELPNGTTGASVGNDGVLLSNSEAFVIGNTISANLGNGLEISGMPQLSDIAIESIVQGNMIGTKSDGTVTTAGGFSVEGNLGDGILIDNGAQFNIIGAFMTNGAGVQTPDNQTQAQAHRNLISGNRGWGVHVAGMGVFHQEGPFGTDGYDDPFEYPDLPPSGLLWPYGAIFNSLSANDIGTENDGATAAPNMLGGVLVDNAAAFTLVGDIMPGPGPQYFGNVISGNGVQVSGTLSTGTGGDSGEIDVGSNANQIGVGSLIMLSWSGGSRTGVAVDSVVGSTISIEGGEGDVLPAADTAVTIEQGPGVEITGKGTAVDVLGANYIGISAAGTAAVPNHGPGVEIIGNPDGDGPIALNIGGDVGNADLGSRNYIAGNLGPGVLIQDDYDLKRAFFGTPTKPWQVVGGPGNQFFDNFGNPNTAAWSFEETQGSDYFGNIVDSNWIGVAPGALDAVHPYDTLGYPNYTPIAMGNQGDGIEIVDSSDNGIGGWSPYATRNVISANTGSGIHITGSKSWLNFVSQSFIGTGPDGESTSDGIHSFANGGDGILIDNSANHNVINSAGMGETFYNAQLGPAVLFGGDGSINYTALDAAFLVATAGNVIGNNGANGLEINDANDNLIAGGNYIGTDLTGTTHLGNAQNGILVTNGAQGTTIEPWTQADYIDHDPNGPIVDPPANPNDAGLPGDTTPHRFTYNLHEVPNIIAYNANAGITIDGAATTVTTVIGGISQLPDLSFSTGTNQIINNAGDGILIDNGANTNTIGGSTSWDGNLISGNGTAGGTATHAGISIKGTTTEYNNVQGNTIQSNEGDGVLIQDAVHNAVFSNLAIGLNTLNGVELAGSAESNVIGGTASGAGNIITSNQLNGVAVDGSAITVTGVSSDGTYLLLNLASTSGLAPGQVVGLSGVILKNSQGQSFATSATITAIPSGSSTVTTDVLLNGRSPSAPAGAFITANFGNVIENNTIGAQGSPNTGNGLLISASANDTVSGGTIAYNHLDGVLISGASNNSVSATSITNNQQTGIEIVAGAQNNTIGGSDTSAANLISSNQGNGVAIRSTTVAISSVGYDQNGYLTLTVAPASGLYVAQAIGLSGVSLVANGVSTSVSSANITAIQVGSTSAVVTTDVAVNGAQPSSQSNAQVLVNASASNIVENNNIGTDASGTTDLHNVLDGVLISESPANTVSANQIKYNHSNGVEVNGGEGGSAILNNTISSNSGDGVYVANGAEGVGIGSQIQLVQNGGVISANVTPAPNSITNNGNYQVQFDGQYTQYNFLSGHNTVSTPSNGTKAAVYFSGTAQANVVGDGGEGFPNANQSNSSTYILGYGNVITYASGADGIQVASNGGEGNTLIGNDFVGDLNQAIVLPSGTTQQPPEISGVQFQQVNGVWTLDFSYQLPTSVTSWNDVRLDFYLMNGSGGIIYLGTEPGTDPSAGPQPFPTFSVPSSYGDLSGWSLVATATYPTNDAHSDGTLATGAMTTVFSTPVPLGT